jgi:hypothetical protein
VEGEEGEEEEEEEEEGVVLPSSSMDMTGGTTSSRNSTNSSPKAATQGQAHHIESGQLTILTWILTWIKVASGQLTVPRIYEISSRRLPLCDRMGNSRRDRAHSTYPYESFRTSNSCWDRHWQTS